jgi:hypothetical protein
MNSNILPELLEKLQQKSDASSYSDNSWEGYVAILRYVSEVCQRVPTLAALEAYKDDDDIDHILETELEHLASLVAEIFPRRGLQGLEYYLKIPTT